MRIRLLVVLAAAILALPLAAEEAPGSRALQVILLGTGYPRPDADRAGPSTAIVVGERVFIVDAGRNVMTRFWQTGLASKNLRAVFLTHLHSDHTSGLPDLFATSWIFGRSTPLQLYGPAGTADLSEALLKYFAADIHIRRDLTEMQPGAGATINTHIVEEGVVYEDASVRVTAFAVDHRPVVPAFGYRFDLLDPEEKSTYSVAISGDTRPSENLIKYAKGVDILVHEVYLPEHFDDIDSPEVAARLKAYHTSADEVGQVAAAAEVKQLVLSHVIPGDGEKTILERARRHFKGKIVVGKDLMRF